MTAHVLQADRGALFCPMGSGKTSAVFTALDSLFLAGEDHPVLVMAPLRVARTTWPEEARKWNHLRHVSVMPIVGDEKERRAALKYDASVYTVNYDNLVWLVEYYGERWPFRTIIADESTKLKSFRLRQGGKRAAALAKVAHPKTQRFIELTGTPSPNGLGDLWGQMWFLDGGQRLGRTFEAFKQRWFQKSYDGYGLNPLPNAQAEIQEKIKDICLTVDLADYVDIEEPVVVPIYVDLPPRARALYRDMEKQMFMELEGRNVEAFNAATRTQKCLQIASGNVWIEKDRGDWGEVHDVKLQALEDILEEAAGMPVLVAYQWIPSKQRILKAFPQARFLDANPQTEKDWCAGKIPLLVAHPQSAGHGLNLQEGGNILVYYDHWWNLEERMQILERIGPTRQMQSGFKRPVFVYPIIARDTVDEDVIERVDSKREVQDILLDAMKRRSVA